MNSGTAGNSPGRRLRSLTSTARAHTGRPRRRMPERPSHWTSSDTSIKSSPSEVSPTTTERPRGSLGCSASDVRTSTRGSKRGQHHPRNRRPPGPIVTAHGTVSKSVWEARPPGTTCRVSGWSGDPVSARNIGRASVCCTPPIYRREPTTSDCLPFDLTEAALSSNRGEVGTFRGLLPTEDDLIFGLSG